MAKPNPLTQTQDPHANGHLVYAGLDSNGVQCLYIHLIRLFTRPYICMVYTYNTTLTPIPGNPGTWMVSHKSLLATLNITHQVSALSSRTYVYYLDHYNLCTHLQNYRTICSAPANLAEIIRTAARPFPGSLGVRERPNALRSRLGYRCGVSDATSE
jgi:hypothetical protein